MYLLLSAISVCIYMCMYYSTVTFEPLENCSATHAMNDRSCLHQLWLHTF